MRNTAPGNGFLDIPSSHPARIFALGIIATGLLLLLSGFVTIVRDHEHPIVLIFRIVSGGLLAWFLFSG